MKIVKMAGFILLYLLIYVALQFFSVVAAGFVYGVLTVLKKQQLDMNHFFTQNMHFILILAAVMAFFLYILIFAFRNRNLFAYCKFKKISVKNVLLCCMAGVSLNVFITALLTQMPVIKMFPKYEQMMKILLGGDKIVLILVACAIVIPIFEEILFRGLIFNELRDHLPVYAALIIQAIIFGVYHFNLLQAIYSFVLAIIMAWVYLRIDSMWAAILIHIFCNSTAIVLIRLPEEMLFIKYGAFFAGISFCVASAALYMIWAVNDTRCNGVVAPLYGDCQ